MDPKQMNKVLGRAKDGSVLALTFKASLRQGDDTQRALERLMHLASEGWDVKLGDEYFRVLEMHQRQAFGEQGRVVVVSLRRTWRLSRFIRKIQDFLDAVELQKL